MATQQEIEARKKEMRAVGMAGFHTSISGKTLSENESIAREVDESWSTFYVCVKCPYSRVKAGNMRFRIFQTLKDAPSIPMGYSGMPSFTFECFTGNPREMAIAEIKKIVKNEYRYKCVHKDEISCERVLSDEEAQARTFAKQAEGARYEIKETDDDETRRVKAEIKTLEDKVAKFKIINKAIKSGDDSALTALGLSAEAIEKLKHPSWGRAGIPAYEFTNTSAKIRARKEKIK